MFLSAAVVTFGRYSSFLFQVPPSESFLCPCHGSTSLCHKENPLVLWPERSNLSLSLSNQSTGVSTGTIESISTTEMRRSFLRCHYIPPSSNRQSICHFLSAAAPVLTRAHHTHTSHWPSSPREQKRERDGSIAHQNHRHETEFITYKVQRSACVY